MLLSTIFFLFFKSGQGKIPWDFLSAILCHKYHPNHSNRAIYCERRHHLEIWARTRYILFIFWPTSALGKRARLLGTDLISERGIRTIKDKNMEQNSPFLQFVGFMRFVWPCLDDSDGIRDLQWRINLEKIVDCCPMRVMEWSNRLRYSWFCIPSSAWVCF